MKKGCLFLLAILFGMSGFYYWLLSSTELSYAWWIPLLLSLGLTFTIANIQGITQALRRSSASKRHPRDWKDGELVGASGTIQAFRETLNAPFSGKNCVMVEYEIKRIVQSSNNSGSSKLNDALGFLMTPCTITTSKGQVKIVGFPLLDQTFEQECYQEDDYKRAAEYILNTKFKPLTKNPFTVIKEMSAILNDNDGTIKEDMKSEGYFAGKTVEEIEANLREDHYILAEKIVPAGEVVSVFGTYSAKTQSIDVGSGMTNLDHILALGKIDKLLFKNFRNSIIGTLIFGGATVSGHYFVMKLLGLV